MAHHTNPTDGPRWNTEHPAYGPHATQYRAAKATADRRPDYRVGTMSDVQSGDRIRPCPYPGHPVPFDLADRILWVTSADHFDGLVFLTLAPNECLTGKIGSALTGLPEPTVQDDELAAWVADPDEWVCIR